MLQVFIGVIIGIYLDQKYNLPSVEKIFNDCIKNFEIHEKNIKDTKVTKDSKKNKKN